jgi:hypothetical protein
MQNPLVARIAADESLRSAAEGKKTLFAAFLVTFVAVSQWWMPLV